MEVDIIVEMTRSAMLTTLAIAFPTLLVGLLVGLASGFFQAVTQIQDPTISLVPRMIAMLVTLVVCLPWVIEQMLGFTTTLFTMLPVMPAGK
jgi:flagellar biosynthetic protein FliQ